MAEFQLRCCHKERKRRCTGSSFFISLTIFVLNEWWAQYLSRSKAACYQFTTATKGFGTGVMGICVLICIVQEHLIIAFLSSESQSCRIRAMSPINFDDKKVWSIRAITVKHQKNFSTEPSSGSRWVFFFDTSREKERKSQGKRERESERRQLIERSNDNS